MHKNKFTKNAIQAIDYANKACIRLQAPEMSLEHLFMGYGPSSFVYPSMIITFSREIILIRINSSFLS